jgi:glycosyltransferase involved in cell wall biosynthesis
MRVLHYYNWGYFAPTSCGADVIAANQLEYFRHRGWEVDCLIADKPSRAHQAEAFREQYSWVRSIRLLNHPRAPLTLRAKLFAHHQIAQTEAFRRIASEGHDLFFTNYVFTCPLLEPLPHGCKRLLEAHDLMSVAFAGNEQQENPGGDSLANARKSFNFNLENELYRLFDAVLFINDDERRQVQAASTARAFTVPPMMPCDSQSIDSALSGQNDDEMFDLIFVGSGAPMNVRGFTFFYRRVYLPFLRRHRLRIAIVGSVCDLLDVDDCYVTKFGQVAGRLDDFYARSKVVIIPILNGSGVSIKTIECLAHGRAVVTTPIGIRGLRPDPDAFVEMDMQADPDGTAAVLLELLASEPKRQTLQRHAKMYCHSNFGREQYFRRMDQVMAALGLTSPALTRGDTSEHLPRFVKGGGCDDSILAASVQARCFH